MSRIERRNDSETFSCHTTGSISSRNAAATFSSPATGRARTIARISHGSSPLLVVAAIAVERPREGAAATLGPDLGVEGVGLTVAAGLGEDPRQVGRDPQRSLPFGLRLEYVHDVEIRAIRQLAATPLAHGDDDKPISRRPSVTMWSAPVTAASALSVRAISVSGVEPSPRMSRAAIRSFLRRVNRRTVPTLASWSGLESSRPNSRSISASRGLMSPSNGVVGEPGHELRYPVDQLADEAAGAEQQAQPLTRQRVVLEHGDQCRVVRCVGQEDPQLIEAEVRVGRYRQPVQEQGKHLVHRPRAPTQTRGQLFERLARRLDIWRIPRASRRSAACSTPSRALGEPTRASRIGRK